MRGLKAAVATYPPKLKHEIVRRYLWEAGFSLETARKPAARGEASYVSGCLFRGVACMVQVLYAVNGRWFLNEKGSVAAVQSFPARPQTGEPCHIAARAASHNAPPASASISPSRVALQRVLLGTRQPHAHIFTEPECSVVPSNSTGLTGRFVHCGNCAATNLRTGAALMFISSSCILSAHIR